MKDEFKRYGLNKYRFIVGSLQLIGGIDLLFFQKNSYLTLIGAGGLAILMLMGLIVRISIKDRVIQFVPATFYMLLNLVIALEYAKH